MNRKTTRSDTLQKKHRDYGRILYTTPFFTGGQWTPLGLGGAGRAGSAAGSSAGRAGVAGMIGFFKGGLVGMASRHVTSSAAKSAVTNTSSFHTAQSQVQQASAVQTTAEVNVNSAVHTDGDAAIYAPQAGNAAGGSFVNNVIGSVARGEVSGSITGDMAAQSLSLYMGCTSLGAGGQEVPAYSDVEIGRGRRGEIPTGRENSAAPHLLLPPHSRHDPRGAAAFG